MTWDKANRLRKADDSLDSPNGTVQLTYDARFDTVYQDISAQGTVTNGRYLNGLRAWRDATGNSRLNFGYDGANRLTRLTQTAGAGLAQPTANEIATLAYDDANRPSSLTLPNGMKTVYTRDDAGQVGDLSYFKTGDVLLGNLAYTYDDRGLRTTRGGTLGNTLLAAATTATAQYDADNALIRWNNIALTYDANGNVKTYGGTTYAWNSRGQLTGLSNATTTASFQYDALGRRRSKTVNGITTQYLHDGHTPIQEQDDTGAVKANTLKGPGIDQYLVRYQDGQSYGYLTDALGSTIRLTAANQAVVASYSYGPYGNTNNSNPTLENPYQYTGRENDGTGLYYYRARYYHPGLGRFISEDPIGLAGGDNLYRYVGGNPVSRIDPSGLTQCDIDVGRDLAEETQPDLKFPKSYGSRDLGLTADGKRIITGLTVPGVGTILDDYFQGSLNNYWAEVLLNTIIHEGVHFTLPIDDPRQPDDVGEGYRGYAYDEGDRRTTKGLVGEFNRRRKSKCKCP